MKWNGIYVFLFTLINCQQILSGNFHTLDGIVCPLFCNRSLPMCRPCLLDPIELALWPSRSLFGTWNISANHIRLASWWSPSTKAKNIQLIIVWNVNRCQRLFAFLNSLAVTRNKPDTLDISFPNFSQQFRPCTIDCAACHHPYRCVWDHLDTVYNCGQRGSPVIENLFLIRSAHLASMSHLHCTHLARHTVDSLAFRTSKLIDVVIADAPTITIGHFAVSRILNCALSDA